MNTRSFTFALALLLTVTVALAATNDLTTALQRGLFEEEANRNLEAATAAYQSLVGQFDKDRQIAATAVFRLGEVYRKQGKTNEAVLQYERIVKEFADQQTLATLSRQNLIGLGASAPARPAPGELPATPMLSSAARAEQRRLMEEEIKLVEQKLADQQKLRQNGMISQSVLVETQRELLELKRRLVALSDEPPINSVSADEQARLLTAQISGIERLEDNPVEQARSVVAIFPDEDLKKKLFELPNSPPNTPETVAPHLQDIKRRVDFILNTQKARLRVLAAMASQASAVIPGGSASTLDGLQSQHALLKAQLEQARKETNLALVAKLYEDVGLQGSLNSLARSRDNLSAAKMHNSPQEPIGPLEAEVRNLEEVVENAHKKLFDYQELRLRILESAIQQAKAATAPKLTDLSVPPPTDDEDQEIRRIQAMIQNSPDLINALSGTANLTLLARAASLGQLRVAQFLLDHGAAINRRSGSTQQYQFQGTPLHFAAQGGHKAMVELLLKNGADVNAVTSTGNTPLHIAVEKGFRGVIESLVSTNVDLNARQKDGGSALHLAAGLGHGDIANPLLQKGADVNVKDNRGDTPLLIAANSGHRAMAVALLDAKADVNAANKTGRTPLHAAAEAGDLDTVKLLLDRGANVEARQQANNSTAFPGQPAQQGDTTPLLLAVGRGHIAIAQALLERKANPDSVGFETSYPLGSAAASGANEMAELLLKHGANPNFNPVVRNNPLGTPLFKAIEQSHADTVAVLLKYKADPNLRLAPNGNAPLHSAISQPQIVKLLLDAGADPNIKGRDGIYTPLMLAAENGHRESAELLLPRGADVNAAYEDGITALHLAVRRGNQPMVELLLKNKADPNARDKEGRTPLDYAKQQPGPPRPGTLLPPRIMQPFQPGVATVSANQALEASTPQPQANIPDLLRQHGALDELPQWDRITVRRAAVSFSQPVFWKGTNNWNRFNLLELVAVHYNLVSAWTKWSVNYQWTIRDSGSGPSSPRQYGNKSYRTYLQTAETPTGIPFPDLSKIVIRRPTAAGKEWKSIPVNLAEILASGECDKEPWLEWGDVVELPESDHYVDDVWANFGKDTLVQFKKCLKREVQLTITGQTRTWTLAPEFTEGNPFPILIWTANEPCSLVPVLTTSKLLRESSDLSKVKVTRRDPAGGTQKEWVLDCSNPDNTPDLWLRDGDTIEVPEKP